MALRVVSVSLLVFAVVLAVAWVSGSGSSEASQAMPLPAAEFDAPSEAGPADAGAVGASQVGPELIDPCQLSEEFFSLAVALMIAGFPHESFIALGLSLELRMICLDLIGALAHPEGGAVPIRIEAQAGSNFVPVEGMFDPATGMYHGEGVGTVAGFDNVTVEMDMQVELNGDFEATYTMGAAGELPGGFPGVYQITGSFNFPAGETPTPTPSPSPTGSPTEEPPATQVAWGNSNCSGAGHLDDPDPIDSLLVLRGDAGLDSNTGDCPDMGTEIDVAFGSPHIWGDFDCLSGMSPIDSLKLLRFDAGLSASKADGCPDLGEPVTVIET